MTALHDPILTLDGVAVSVRQRSNAPLQLVSDVSYAVAEGECLAVVGESGSGKSITAMAIAGLLENNMTVTGSIRYKGQELTNLRPKARRALAGTEIGFIFQEAMSALHPLLSIKDQMIRPIRLHQKVSARAAEARAAELLDKVGIPPARNVLNSYVHQLSGGLRQRVMIAMALSNSPRLVIADEPTTALDAAVQGQIMELLDELRRSDNLAMILISHDISVVARHSDNIAVMYGGQVLETGPTKAVMDDAQHPYTRALIEVARALSRDQRRLPTVPSFQNSSAPDAQEMIDLGNNRRVRPYEPAGASA
ncbi:ABC transporter ATP-binding protein [Microbacterium sp. EST19A]|uniref:ABC transporter ATP-binding protein n=1 Tax=Microbacterium sp. EST19A TaxID=2862681 RepID=UPI001CBE9B74|nr:ABC transporter ATP-binding protein [Microbacterium sp. EST19A]